MKRLIYRTLSILSLAGMLTLTTACGGGDDGAISIVNYDVQNISITEARSVLTGTWAASGSSTTYTFYISPDGSIVMKNSAGQNVHTGSVTKENGHLYFNLGSMKAEVLNLSTASFSIYYTENSRSYTLTGIKTSTNYSEDASSTIPTVGNANANNTAVDRRYGRLEFPHLKGGSNNIVLIHTVASLGTDNVNYSVEWDSDLQPTGWTGGGTLRSQRWSAYTMHNGNTSSKTDRWRDYEYPNDPLLSSQYQFSSDPYWGSGYDHGHIFPSADRAYSYNNEANKQTFYLTNMQPQVNGFNARVWANMEAQVRKWNSRNFRDTLYIVKGGTIDNAANIMGTIGSGSNRIPVPKYFFMAVLCKNSNAVNGGYKALGFWIEHKASDDSSLGNYVVNIDQLELLTGIDFFCNLPDAIENAVEALPADNVRRAFNL